MKIKLKGPFNQTWIDVETTSTRLGALLDELSVEGKAHSIEFFDLRNGSVSPDCEIYLNGKSYSVFTDRLNTRLNDNDTVEISLIILTGG